MMVGLTRREFVKVGMAAGATTVVLERAGGLDMVMKTWAPPPQRQQAEEKSVASVCLQCPAGCGILVRVVNGKAVKIEGNPLHPINEGRLCPKGQIGLQLLYDPDRTKGPLVRPSLRQAYEENKLAEYLNLQGTRERVPEDLVPVEGGTPEEVWSTAIGLFAAVLKTLRDGGEPHKLVFMSGRNRGQMGGFIDRWCEAFGTKNHVGHSSICADGSPQAHVATQGWKSYAGYDWDNTNYILCFGGSFIEAWRPTTRLLRAYGHMHRGRPLRGKLVQVESRLSVTAAKADEWLPIKPGTDGALAIAIAHVIVRDSLFDVDFVRAHSDLSHLVDENTGKPLTEPVTEDSTTYNKYYVWDESAQTPALWNPKTRSYEPATTVPALWGEYTVKGVLCKTVFQLWKEEVLDAMSPERAETITGIPARTIERVAWEFATTKPAIAAGERGASMQTNGLYNRMAIHALNLLVGSIEVPGGVLNQRGPSLASYVTLYKDDVANAGWAQPRIDYAGTRYYPMAAKVYQGIPDFILDRPDPAGRPLPGPYDIKVILCYYTNPMFSTPDVERWYEAIKRVPLLVTFSPFMDETTAHADLVLPDDTYLERYHDDVIYPSLGYPVVGMRQPVVSRIYNTLDTGTVLIRTAQAIGGTAAQSFPWTDFQEVLKQRYRKIFDDKVGTVGNIPVSEFATFDEFWAKFLETGVWKQYPYTFYDWSNGFKTETKKFEILSSKLEHTFEGVAPTKEELESLLQELKIQARGEAVYMPHYEPPRYVGNENEYPLHLVTYKLMAHAEGRGANVPFLRELSAPHIGHLEYNWDTWVEINPDTARSLPQPIKDGELVWVESPVKDPQGSTRRIKVRARFYEGAMPDVVSIPFELGHRNYGRWAKNTGANPNTILANEYDLLGGLAAFSATRVKVYLAGGEG